MCGYNVYKKIGEYEIEGDKIKKAPILFAGTMVQDGQGVCVKEREKE